ncbi:MAG: zinc-ribbon domain-containing protein [bacterium]
MYCKECGKQLIENSTFCKYCGASQNNPIQIEYPVSDDENSSNDESSVEQQKRIIKKHKIFHSENEVLIDTLGSGFLSSLFVQKSFSKSVMFCSNKRIYQKGKIFKRNINGKITYYHGEQCVDLREVTGISFLIDDPVNRLFFSFLMLVLGIVGFTLASEQRGDLALIISIVSGALIGAFIGSLIIYGLKKGKYFIIEYAGGEIITNSNWYSYKSIKRFMKNVSLQRDKLFE